MIYDGKKMIISCEVNILMILQSEEVQIYKLCASRTQLPYLCLKKNKAFNDLISEKDHSFYILFLRG